MILNHSKKYEPKFEVTWKHVPPLLQRPTEQIPYFDTVLKATVDVVVVGEISHKLPICFFYNFKIRIT